VNSVELCDSAQLSRAS